MGLYDFYTRHVFARFIDVSMRPLAKFRPATLAEAHGEVLEVGFGTGLNLPHYPAAVKRLTALDPLDALPARVQQRITAAPFPVERHTIRANGTLPFESERFDSVTMTWTLCSIDDPIGALREMRRVLRPEGKLLFIEHGRSEDARVAGWQDRLNPIQRVIGCGCNLNRRIDLLISEAGFALDRLERFTLDRWFRLYTETYRGTATKTTGGDVDAQDRRCGA